ncbi:hypothetical protein LG274_09395 [Micrococcus antarcticus]|uniref:hypothetical protein n=1 Tax=Micrococcus antarcticus TaxID=86171 RepID=UPI00384FF779
MYESNWRVFEIFAASRQLVAVTALGAMFAAAAHGILAATTTLEEQPRPEPVPLDRRTR